MSQIITAPIPLVLSTYIPTQMESSFIRERSAAKIIYKNVFFCCNRLLHLLEPVLFYMALVSVAFCLIYFLSKKDPN
jgi:hypothetical protein